MAAKRWHRQQHPLKPLRDRRHRLALLHGASGGHLAEHRPAALRQQRGIECAADRSGHPAAGAYRRQSDHRVPGDTVVHLHGDRAPLLHGADGQHLGDDHAGRLRHEQRQRSRGAAGGAAHHHVPATISYNVATTSSANSGVLSSTITTTTAVTVAPYYTVQTGDSWSIIAQAVYGDAQAGSALQAALGGAASPTVGAHLTVPQTLAYNKSVSPTVQTDVTDPLGLVSSLFYDGGGQL